jgi:hypothetical protein
MRLAATEDEQVECQHDQHKNNEPGPHRAVAKDSTFAIMRARKKMHQRRRPCREYCIADRVVELWIGKFMIFRWLD